VAYSSKFVTVSTCGQFDFAQVTVLILKHSTRFF